MKYVALLRGINVGGKNMIKMIELKTCLEKLGLQEVHTYIQTGNIIFDSNESDTLELAKIIRSAIHKEFKADVPTLVLSEAQLKVIMKNVPKGWGEDPEWKYNMLFLIPPYETEQIFSGIGELKPEIETLTPGKGILYQSMSIKLFGRTTTGKLASKPVYKQITIRNYNTTKKIYDLMTIS